MRSGPHRDGAAAVQADLQSRRWPPAGCSDPSAAAPPAAPCRRWTRWASAPAPCAGCCCTSPPCCGCRTAAEGDGQPVSGRFSREEQKAAETGQSETHESVEHLVQNRAQTPPVHGPVVRLLLQNLWSQVLGNQSVTNPLQRQTLYQQHIRKYLHLHMKTDTEKTIISNDFCLVYGANVSVNVKQDKTNK